MDPAWKVRNGALDQLSTILASNKRIKSSLGKLFHFVPQFFRQRHLAHRL
jgi:hypothetical protein